MAGIRWLSETRADERALTGGKGASLGELIRLGMPVPNGFVVTTDAYVAESEGWRLRDALAPLLAKEDWSSVACVAREILQSRPLSSELSESLVAAYRKLGAHAVAVRSSATAEDSDTASFAGQYDSFLNVHGEEELIRAIRQCWASLWSERALRYRHERSIDHLSAAMAVVVQEMVPSDVSGVVFTVDPIAHRDDCMHVEAAAGSGEGLVSGMATTEVYRLDRSTLALCDQRKNEGLLNEGRLAELCRFALEIEKSKGCPQDIEFAIAWNQIYILQARPITTLNVGPEWIEPLGEPSLVDKQMQPIAAERYAMAPRPLDSIVFTRLVGAVMYTVRKFGGQISLEDEADFRAQIWHQAYRLPRVRFTPKLLLAQWKYLRLLSPDWLAWWTTGPRHELNAVCAPVDWTLITNEDLFRHAERVLAAWEDVLNQRFYASSAINARTWLERIVGMVVGRKGRDQVLADLLAGLQTPTSKVNQALWGLSRLVRQDPALRAAIGTFHLDTVSAADPNGTFLGAFHRFLERYGHREGAGYFLSTPVWRRDPVQVLRLVSSLAEVEERQDSTAEILARCQRARTVVERRLRFMPGLTLLFRWLLDRIRSLDIFRETTHFDITRPLATLQEIIGELARRLQSRGVLQNSDDIYYLTYAELRNWCLERPPSPNEVKLLIARRRATYDLVNARWQLQRSTVQNPRRELAGIAVSRGIARGRARVIRDERDFHLLQPGEVLVCPYSNPAWTPLFISASAVVSETGGAASHAAIVAREYGIPAVMSVSGATEALQHGPEVVVDGERGIVALVVSPAWR